MNRSAAFTLIEVLAAVFLTAVVMTVAITFFVQLSDATDAAARKAKRGRQALAVIDRIARDLEGAYLRIAPAEQDPIGHPWFFVAESQEGEPGADRIQFISRNHRPRNPLDHGSDLALVTWLMQPADDAPGYELLRAVEPGLPLSPPGDFLSADDERFMLVAENIQHFGMRFMGEEREWVEEWDSSQLERSGLLPLAAEIEIEHLPERRQDAEYEDFDDLGRFSSDDDKNFRYARQVLIPMRPVDVDAMLRAAVDEKTQAEQESEIDTTNEDLRRALEEEGLGAGDLPANTGRRGKRPGRPGGSRLAP